jgi:hypothetical protein
LRVGVLGMTCALIHDSSWSFRTRSELLLQHRGVGERTGKQGSGGGALLKCPAADIRRRGASGPAGFSSDQSGLA